MKDFAWYYTYCRAFQLLPDRFHAGGNCDYGLQGALQKSTYLLCTSFFDMQHMNDQHAVIVDAAHRGTKSFPTPFPVVHVGADV